MFWGLLFMGYRVATRCALPRELSRPLKRCTERIVPENFTILSPLFSSLTCFCLFSIEFLSSRPFALWLRRKRLQPSRLPSLSSRRMKCFTALEGFGNSSITCKEGINGYISRHRDRMMGLPLEYQECRYIQLPVLSSKSPKSGSVIIRIYIQRLYSFALFICSLLNSGLKNANNSGLSLIICLSSSTSSPITVPEY